jgi:hypothetical protein
MSWLEKNLENCIKGFAGEDLVRNLFINKKIPFMQVDIMFKYNNKWCLGEIKTQEKFTKNINRGELYDGHGLPEWQIKKRMEFYEDTKIIPYLIVYEEKDNCIYIESLINLLQKEHFKTKGNKPRVIFNIDSFKKITI